MEHESDGDINCNRYARFSYQKICKETGRIGNKNTNGNHPNNSIVEIGHNTEKSSGDLRILALTQTPVKDHQLMRV